MSSSKLKKSTPRRKQYTPKRNKKAIPVIEDEYCTVEYIIKSKFDKFENNYKFLVKWEEFSKEEATWEITENLVESDGSMRILLKYIDDNFSKEEAQKMRIFVCGSSKKKWKRKKTIESSDAESEFVEDDEIES